MISFGGFGSIGLVRCPDLRASMVSKCWFGTSSMKRAAFARERQIKKWNRSWKLQLIETMNPGWRDLWGRCIRVTEDPVPRFSREERLGNSSARSRVSGNLEAKHS
jgi:hypothetical protein